MHNALIIVPQESEGPESEYVDEGAQDDDMDELHSEDEDSKVRPHYTSHAIVQVCSRVIRVFTL